MTYKNKQKSHLYNSEEGYNLYADRYDEKSDYLNSFEKENLRKFLGNLSGKKVLDLGCGTGRITGLLLNSGAEVTGLDVSGKMLEIARGKFPAATFVQGNAEKLPFKDEEFDFTVAAFLIVHIKNLKKTFDEVYRVLKAGGKFILTNVNQKKAPKLETRDRKKIVICSYYHIPEHLTKELENSLFKIVDEEYVYENGVWINQIITADK